MKLPLARTDSLFIYFPDTATPRMEGDRGREPGRKGGGRGMGDGRVKGGRREF